MRFITSVPDESGNREIVFHGDDKSASIAAMDAATHIPGFLIYDYVAGMRRANPKFAPKAAKSSKKPAAPEPAA